MPVKKFAIQRITMKTKRIESNQRLCQAAVHGNTVYLTGQVGNPGQSVKEQTQTILASVDRLLEAAGSNKANVLQATIWLADIADFGQMNEAWDAWVDQSSPPARSTSEARMTSPDYRVEITVIAALADQT